MNMDGLKVCFVGVGSIAKRHIRNLRYIFEKGNVPLAVDAFRRNEFHEDSVAVDHVFTRMEDVPDDYDIVFITNPTEYHLESLKVFHQKGKNFFIEKPLVSPHQVKEAMELQRRNDAVYYVACPLRYNAVIQYIKNNIDPHDVLSVRSISSSYLPDWRPGKDYRQTYSAKKALGGGVGIDLIHEWDYLTYLFGMPERVCCMTGKKSNLEIDSEDYAIYIAEMKDKIVELHLDYFGRQTLRQIQLIMHDETIMGDLVNNRIVFVKSGKTIPFEDDRDSFQQRELKLFLKSVNKEAERTDDYENALRVIRLTQGEID